MSHTSVPQSCLCSSMRFISRMLSNKSTFGHGADESPPAGCFFIQRSDSSHLKFLRHIYERKCNTFVVPCRPCFNYAFRSKASGFKYRVRNNLPNLLLPFCVLELLPLSEHSTTRGVTLAFFFPLLKLDSTLVQCILYSAASPPHRQRSGSSEPNCQRFV